MEIRLTNVVNQRFYFTFFKRYFLTIWRLLKVRNFEITNFDTTPPRNFQYKHNILLRIVFSWLTLSITPYIFDALQKL